MYQKRNRELDVVALLAKSYGSEFYLRQISKLSNIPLKTTQNILTALEARKIIKSTYKGKHRYFSINLANVQAKLLVMQAEIYKTSLFLEKYPYFKTFLKEIAKIAINASLVVFGSFARFSADKTSDVDLLAVSEKEPQLPSYLLPNKIHLITLSEDSFLEALQKQEVFIKEVEGNHVILNNHSFYINAVWGHYGK